MLLNSLSTVSRRWVSRELAKQGSLVRAKDGGDPTPPLNVLKLFIKNEVDAMGILDSGYGRKNSKATKVDGTIVKDSGSKDSQSISIKEAEKKIESLTEAFSKIAQKLEQLSQPRSQTYQRPAEGKNTIAVSPSHVPYRPAQQFSKQLKCYYCFKEGHTVQRCAVSNQDILSGRVVREAQGYVLPDGALIPYNITRPIAPIVEAYSKAHRGSTNQLVQHEDMKKEENKTNTNQVNQLEMLEISPELFQKVKEELYQKEGTVEDFEALPEEYHLSFGILEAWDPPVISSNHFETNYFLRGGRATKEPDQEFETGNDKGKKKEKTQEEESEVEEFEVPGGMPSSSKKIKVETEQPKGPIIREPAKVQQALERIEKARREEIERNKKIRIEQKKKQQEKEEAEIFKEAEKIRKEMEDVEEKEVEDIRMETITS